MKVSTLVRLGAAALLLTASAVAEDAAPAVDVAAETEAARAAKVQEITKEGLFVETFEGEELFDGTRWFKSRHEKYSSQEVSIEEYTLEAAHATSDRGLVLDKPAKHYGLAVKLDEPMRLDGSPERPELVVQYEVKLQKGLNCGGAYVKLLRAPADAEEPTDLSAFSDATPFVVMFGPDKCGSNDKVHLIFQHKNPVSGEYEEKHLDNAPRIMTDKNTHVYTAVIRDDNTYEILLDQASVSSGSLLENFEPPVIPEKEIDDPEDSKPEDWEDKPQIRDPDAVKPDDWDEDAPARIPDLDAVKPEGWLDDEPALIDDPAVKKPEDWDDEDDGEWIAPQIPNPKCDAAPGCGEWTRPTKANPDFKGKWHAPLIRNPKYKGEWAPRKIPNPNYFEDEHPARFDAIGALAVEVWTMSEGITFDNFWLGYDLQKAKEFAELTWKPKHDAEVAEQEKKKKASEQEEEGGIWQTAERLANDFAEYAQANPVVALGAVAAVAALSTLLAFVMCCSSSSSSPAPAATEKKDDSGSESDKNSEDKSAESDDSSNGRKLRQRKKAPMVKDD